MLIFMQVTNRKLLFSLNKFHGISPSLTFNSLIVLIGNPVLLTKKLASQYTQLQVFDRTMRHPTTSSSNLRFGHINTILLKFTAIHPAFLKTFPHARPPSFHFDPEEPFTVSSLGSSGVFSKYLAFVRMVLKNMNQEFERGRDISKQSSSMTHCSAEKT